MVAGIGVSLIASIVGALPLLAVGQKPPAQRHTAILTAMALRVAATLGLLLAVVFGSELARKPLVLWAGISYLGFLFAETLTTVRQIQTGKL